MSTSIKGGSKKRKSRRATLSWLKSAAIVIAVLDLILAINDSRNVGRFFLLLTMSTTFSIVPENLIRDHCRESISGICETYTQFATGKRLPSIKETVLKRRAYFGTREESSPFLPELIKELVMSWKSMFDQSRADTNVSFYYDDFERGGKGGIRMMQHQEAYSSLSSSISQSPSQTFQEPSYLLQKKEEDNNQKISHLNSQNDSPTHVDSVESLKNGEGGDPSSHSGVDKITTRSSSGGSGRDSIQSFSNAHESIRLRLGRKKRDVLEEENADTGSKVTSKHILNANALEQISSSSISSSATTFKTMSIDKETTKETLVMSSPTVFISENLTTRDSLKPLKPTQRYSTTKPFEGKIPMRSRSNPSIKFNSTHRRNSNNRRNSSGSGESIKILDFGLISKGPKELMGYVEEELFTRWPSLLENVQILLEQKNMTSLQLVSPEATRIKMHIEVRPFGPDPFKDARKRLKATQQTLFDYPWLTMVQLYGDLSESYTKMFIVISVYTWIFGTVIAIMLLIGSYREDQTILHAWMVFNILYTLLQFLIDNWIHANIGVERSSLYLWLFNIYSVYKPLAAYIAITQLAEIEKVRFDSAENYTMEDCLTTSSKISCSSVQSSLSKSETVEGTMDESSAVNIIPTSSGKTLLSPGEARQNIVCGDGNGCFVVSPTNREKDEFTEEDDDEGDLDEDDYEDSDEENKDHGREDDDNNDEEECNRGA